MPTIKSLDLKHGELISCEILGYAVEEGMVIIVSDRLYVLQNLTSGSAPENFHEINDEFGTSYKRCYCLGRLGGYLDNDIRNIKKLNKIITPPKFSAGDRFLDTNGEAFYIRKFIEGSKILLLENESGILSKMISVSEFRRNFFDEKNFKPLTSEELYNRFYEEDIFSKLIIKKFKPGNMPVFSTFSNGFERRRQEIVRLSSLEIASRIRSRERDLESFQRDLEAYTERALESHVLVSETERSLNEHQNATDLIVSFWQQYLTYNRSVSINRHHQLERLQRDIYEFTEEIRLLNERLQTITNDTATTDRIIGDLIPNRRTMRATTERLNDLWITDMFNHRTTVTGSNNIFWHTPEPQINIGTEPDSGI